ncbi:MAG TPA: symmetrical bis(5'-nucleosyl)-tetraphosphatase [Steroidobacteraceae bacterium]|nr:symmetrical bis(5'-nucleosyl)-tetraphosphatase [Steroidobacteraceae bacterium]
MPLYAIGDVQGCDAELERLLKTLRFSPDRDRLWFVGDLVNRGPASLAVLRRVRALGEAATVTLGNHDLHLLAVALGGARLRSGDTLDAILAASDRDELLEWLAARPLLAEDRALNLCLVHAGLSPQWDLPTARGCARELEQALKSHPQRLFRHMYGDKPDRWDASLEGAERLRYIVNCFTRLRYLDAQGRLELHAKGAPSKATRAALMPWFEAPQARWRGTRVVFGHWSTLGFLQNADVIGLDTGCVWGGSLSALRLDGGDAVPVQIPCASSARG